MQLALMNQRDATRSGWFYGTIIGDWRRGGIYTSYQAEMIARMPKDELAAVLIKEQHNAQSFRKDYRKMRLPFILHEYVLLWKKKDKPLLIILGDLARAQYARLTGTWKNIVCATLVRLGGEAALKSVYESIAQSAPDRIAANANWREKVRQTLNQNASLFKPVARGVWAVA